MCEVRHDDIERQVAREMKAHEREVRRAIDKQFLAEWHCRLDAEDEKIYTRTTRDGRRILIWCRNFWGEKTSNVWFPKILTKNNEVVHLGGSSNLEELARLMEDVCGISHAPIDQARSLR